MTLNAQFRASFVRRWHTNPDLAHTVDTLAGHGGRVARIILKLWPDASPALLKWALVHDDGESVVGIQFCSAPLHERRLADTSAQNWKHRGARRRTQPPEMETSCRQRNMIDGRSWLFSGWK